MGIYNTGKDPCLQIMDQAPNPHGILKKFV